MGLRDRLAQRNLESWRSVDAELDARLSQPVTPAPVERPAPKPKRVPRIARMGPIDAPVGPPKARKQTSRGYLAAKACEVCGVSFVPVRPNQVNCSLACRRAKQVKAEQAKKLGIGFGFRCACGENMPVYTTSEIDGGLRRYRRCRACGDQIVTREVREAETTT